MGNCWQCGAAFLSSNRWGSNCNSCKQTPMAWRDMGLVREAIQQKNIAFYGIFPKWSDPPSLTFGIFKSVFSKIL